LDSFFILIDHPQGRRKGKRRKVSGKLKTRSGLKSSKRTGRRTGEAASATKALFKKEKGGWTAIEQG